MRLTVERVSLAYETAAGERVDALAAVSLEVASGEVLGVVGRTGSGKTSLLEVMAGARRPDAGCVLVDGADALREPRARARLADAVGLVFQQPERQFFETSVAREVAFGPACRGATAEEARERGRRACALLGLDLDELAERSPLTLSGGQQRRLAIASVLACEPGLLLLDEPTAGLDPRSRRACLDAVRAAADKGAAVVVASHDADALAEVAGRVAVLEGGRLTLDGPARELLGDAPLMREHGLDGCACARAAESLRAAGLPVEGAALTPAELATAIMAARGGGA